MNQLINKKIIIFLLCQLLSQWVLAQNEILECSACLEDKDTCFNTTLPEENVLTIKSRGVEYLDLYKNNDVEKALSSNNERGRIIEISYIVTSTNGDSITVQIENAKDQYVIESRDNRVECSSRNKLKLYKQNERIAIYCNNLYYECNVMYQISVEKPQEEEKSDKIPDCSECAVESENTCIESIYLPVHSWFYLYYDGEGGTYLDFLVSSHKKDTMRIEVQSGDGTFYLVSTRKDKAKCSDRQMSVPVRSSTSRVAVYCYNNYIGCKFSIYIHGQSMNKSVTSSSSSSSSSSSAINIEKMMGYAEATTPRWSEWSEWSECIESHNGMGKQTRERTCLNAEVDFTHPESTTQEQHKEMERMLAMSDFSSCEGPSMEEQNCEVEDDMQHPWQNIMIFGFIVSALILSFKLERKPTPQPIHTSQEYLEDVVKSNDLEDENSPDNLRRISVSENSPLLNTYFRRYD